MINRLTLINSIKCYYLQDNKTKPINYYLIGSKLNK